MRSEDRQASQLVPVGDPGHVARAQQQGVALDGKPANFLRYSGVAHATKSKIELGVAGKDGFFDDIKVWNAEAAKP